MNGVTWSTLEADEVEGPWRENNRGSTDVWTTIHALRSSEQPRLVLTCLDIFMGQYTQVATRSLFGSSFDSGT